MIWLLAHPLPPSPVSKLDSWPAMHTERNCWRMREGVGEGGAELYDSKNAWSSINHAILSGWFNTVTHLHGCHGSSLCSVQKRLSKIGKCATHVCICTVQYWVSAIQNNTKMIFKIGILVYMTRNVRWTLNSSSMIDDIGLNMKF